MSFGATQWLLGFLALPALIAFFFRAEQKGAQRLREALTAQPQRC